MQLGHTPVHAVPFAESVSFATCMSWNANCSCPADNCALWTSICPARKPQNQIDFVYSSQDMSPVSWQLNWTQLNSTQLNRTQTAPIFITHLEHCSYGITHTTHCAGRTIELPALFGHWALDVCM